MNVNNANLKPFFYGFAKGNEMQSACLLDLKDTQCFLVRNAEYKNNRKTPQDTLDKQLMISKLAKSANK